jgi:hypothetical protein
MLCVSWIPAAYRSQILSFDYWTHYQQLLSIASTLNIALLNRLLLYQQGFLLNVHMEFDQFDLQHISFLDRTVLLN